MPKNELFTGNQSKNPVVNLAIIGFRRLFVGHQSLEKNPQNLWSLGGAFSCLKQYFEFIWLRRFI